MDRLATYERDPNYFSKAIVRLNEKEETKVADQKPQNFANFFEVRGVRDKRHEEMRLVPKGKGKRVTMEGN